ncbi:MULTISPECIES: plasmid mobilization protein [Bacillota]|uniref:plasmid mobilization protein n=1 Tax=Bacillota TaxID=1239 RepID=UPI00300F9693
MANRKRNIQLKICLNEEEKQIFEKKMKLAKCKTMSHFLRKCVLEKEIYQVDLQPFADLQGLLYNATSNINQIAKRVNSTGIIYSDDIGDMKKQIDHISKEIWQIHALLLGRTAETGDDK